VITGVADARVTRVGSWLRKTKVDELPQLMNVLRGEMSLVGPRPEDPSIVTAHYRPAHWRTLDVRPGLVSPGSLYNYTHGESLLRGEQPESAYVERLLPLKLALELVYLDRRCFRYDLALVFRTALTILRIAAGRTRFADPPELAEATRRAQLILSGNSA
jgi:lipopolysaccharide/colanic/teichoic acid biosynthesis glycosyltransferase